MAYRRTIEDVVAALRDGKRGGCPATLIIGPGSSRSNGVPPGVGSGAVASLGDAARQALFQELTTTSVSWADLSIATLLKHEFINRVLVVGVDSQIVRACAMVGEFPLIYDATVGLPKAIEKLDVGMIVYLHGQAAAMAPLVSSSDRYRHVERLAPLFSAVNGGGVWIVADWDDPNDPAFEMLVKQRRDAAGSLYWLSSGSVPSRHVRDRLLLRRDGAGFVGECGTDHAFVSLAGALECLPPPVIDNPFNTLGDMVGSLAPYSVPGAFEGLDVANSVMRYIDQAAAQYERTILPELQLLTKDYAGIIAERQSILAGGDASAVDALVWAYLLRGREIAERARKMPQGEAADVRFAEACKSILAASDIRPEMAEPHHYYGVVLLDQAESAAGDAAARLLILACRKFAVAVEINPRFVDAYYQWGYALSAAAMNKDSEIASQLRLEACEKYAMAEALRPDRFVTLNNWGITLADRAAATTGDQADPLFKEAYEKFSQALKIDPDRQEAYFNWGVALFDHARQSADGAVSDQLYEEAYKKYAAAVELAPELLDVYLSWGWALSGQAMTKTGAEADPLFAEAYRKYEAALVIKADSVDALHNWAWTLTAQARIGKSGAVDLLYAQACEKYEQAAAWRPNDSHILANWGDAQANLALMRAGSEALRLFTAASDKFAEATRISPDSYLAHSYWASALTAHAKIETGAERQRLLSLAIEQGSKVDELEPGSSSYDLACLVALRGEGEGECRRWLERSLAFGSVPGRQSVEEDPDLASVRGAAWFQAFLDKLPKEERTRGLVPSPLS